MRMATCVKDAPRAGNFRQWVGIDQDREVFARYLRLLVKAWQSKRRALSGPLRFLSQARRRWSPMTVWQQHRSLVVHGTVLPQYAHTVPRGLSGVLGRPAHRERRFPPEPTS